MKHSITIFCTLVLLQCVDVIVSFTPLVSKHRVQTQQTVLFAKKKGKKNKKNNKKSGFEWATSFVLKPFEAQVDRKSVV